MMSTELLAQKSRYQPVPTQFLLENFQNLRIIKPSLIFLHGIPEFLSDPSKLQEQVEIYGTINKISIKKISKDFYSAFVDFDQPLYAAMAIFGINGFQLSNRKIRASYGSTKFCPSFLKNQNCNVNDCNYAHFYDAFLTFYKEYLQEFNHKHYAANQLKSSKLMYIKTHLKNKLTKPDKKQIKIFPSGMEILKELEREDTPIKSDEWDELHSEIDTYIEGKEQAQKEKQKTRIQLFLDEAEKTLMQLIFKSAVF